jgi:hypothetical protein
VTRVEYATRRQPEVGPEIASGNTGGKQALRLRRWKPWILFEKDCKLVQAQRHQPGGGHLTANLEGPRPGTGKRAGFKRETWLSG